MLSVGKDVIAPAKVIAGSESSLEPTFQAVAVPGARRLYSLALSILRDEGEAEDAVQETLLKAWRSWDSVSRMERPVGWLTRVCVNHCISRRRHLRSRGWPPLALIEEVAP
jgi:DNA-directed RNA polymerase specialized sigma24 family protein